MDSRILLVGAALAAIVAGCNKVEAEAKPAAPPPVVQKLEPEKAPVDPSKMDRAVLSKCKRAAVFIINFEGDKFTSTGSGFVVDGGMRVVTNKHVVTGTDEEIDDCQLVFYSGSDEMKTVSVKAANIAPYDDATREDRDYDSRDLAMIDLETKMPDALEMGSSEELIETDVAWAFGFPHGPMIRVEDDRFPSPTVHSLRVERIEQRNGQAAVLQLAGTPTYGDSGGAVVNSQGKVVGVLQAIQGETTSIVYAVPTRPLLNLLSRPDKGATVAGAQPSHGDEPVLLDVPVKSTAAAGEEAWLLISTCSRDQKKLKTPFAGVKKSGWDSAEIQFSSDYDGLRPNLWMILLGSYKTKTDAEAAEAAAEAAGIDCYVKFAVPIAGC